VLAIHINAADPLPSMLSLPPERRSPQARSVTMVHVAMFVCLESGHSSRLLVIKL